MKKIILTSLTVLAIAGIIVGCATQSPSNQAAENSAITLAAATGTELTLQKQPQDAIYFLGAEQALNTISSGTNAVTVTTVESALQAAGVTNAIISISIDEAITLGDSLIQSNAGTNSSVAYQETQVVAGDIANGIQQGLSLAGNTTLKKPVK